MSPNPTQPMSLLAFQASLITSLHSGWMGHLTFFFLFFLDKKGLLKYTMWERMDPLYVA